MVRARKPSSILDMIDRLTGKVDRLTILSSVLIARHQTPSLIGIFVIFASFVITIAWSDAATPRVKVTNGCDSVIEPGASLPKGNIDLLGVTLYKQPKRCTKYRALQMLVE